MYKITKGLPNAQVRSLCPRQKKIYLLIVQTILMSNLFSAIFFSNIQRAITSAELSAIFHPQAFETAIISAERSTIFDNNHEDRHYFSRIFSSLQ